MIMKSYHHEKNDIKRNYNHELTWLRNYNQQHHMKISLLFKIFDHYRYQTNLNKMELAASRVTFATDYEIKYIS